MSALGLSTLRDLISSLPTGERRLVLLKYADGFDDAEIAQILGMDAEQVTSRIEALEHVLFEQMQTRFEAELGADRALAA
ncbi:MAG: hypothetical protein DYG94_05610 [Leptolyngbya sp. PLA3]|nr:MAG: hypothetical protein EDM82_04510 [Cyanobacteria bacterium CYA]MCE7968209.1 hypothetical protein [Leptolyngbya sp. PL-A3]